MADAFLFKGGMPEPKFMWCKGETVDYHGPFGHVNQEDTAPFDAHFDGAYGSGLRTYAAGMPFNFKKMPWQKNAIKKADLKVGDFIRALWVPCDHYTEYIRFDVARPDVRLAGATVRMSAQYLAFNTTTMEFEYVKATDVTDAATAQNNNNPIPLDRQSSTMISLLKCNGTVTGTGTGVAPGGGGTVDVTVTGTSTGYTMPLYVAPILIPTDPNDPTNPYKVVRANPAIFFGLEIVSLPTAAGVTLDMAQNDWYLSIRLAGFSSATHL